MSNGTVNSGQVLTASDRQNLISALQKAQEALGFLQKCQACGIDVTPLLADLEFIRQSGEAIRQQFPEMR